MKGWVVPWLTTWRCKKNDCICRLGGLLELDLLTDVDGHRALVRDTPQYAGHSQRAKFSCIADAPGWGLRDSRDFFSGLTRVCAVSPTRRQNCRAVDGLRSRCGCCRNSGRQAFL